MKKFNSGFSRNVINNINFLAGAAGILAFWIEAVFEF